MTFGWRTMQTQAGTQRESTRVPSKGTSSSIPVWLSRVAWRNFPRRAAGEPRLISLRSHSLRACSNCAIRHGLLDLAKHRLCQAAVDRLNMLTDGIGRSARPRCTEHFPRRSNWLLDPSLASEPIVIGTTDRTMRVAEKYRTSQKCLTIRCNTSGNDAIGLGTFDHNHTHLDHPWTLLIGE